MPYQPRHSRNRVKVSFESGVKISQQLFNIKGRNMSLIWLDIFFNLNQLTMDTRAVSTTPIPLGRAKVSFESGVKISQQLFNINANRFVFPK